MNVESSRDRQAVFANPLTGATSTGGETVSSVDTFERVSVGASSLSSRAELGRVTSRSERVRRSVEDEVAATSASRRSENAHSGRTRDDGASDSGAVASVSSILVVDQDSSRVGAGVFRNASFGCGISNISINTSATARATTTESFSVGRAFGTNRLTRSKVEKRNATAHFDEIEDVGDDTNVSVRARLLGQSVEEEISGNESSILEEAEVKVQVEKLS